MRKKKRLVLYVLVVGLFLLFKQKKSVMKIKTKWNEKRHDVYK